MEASISDFLFTKELKYDYNRFNSEVSALLDSVEKKAKVNKLIYLKSILGNLLYRKKPTNYSLEHLSKLNSAFGLLLIICFALLFLHHLIPGNLDEVDLGFVTIGNHGFQSVDLFIWFQMRKLVMIITLAVWYISSDNWWKYAILSPITLYIFQFWEAFQDERYLDAFGNLKVAPIILLVIAIVILLSKTIKYRVLLLEIHNYLVNELDKIFKELDDENGIVKESLLKYEQVRTEIHTSDDPNERLKKLFELREELQTILEAKS